ncbi:MAG: MFS transporter [Arenicellales bacterium]|jgi:MFS family permease|nr:MFS transporter [Arenicellales bacterium]MDP7221085.1 MFS transporter [Arenicellales bacterium]|tara:strand:- start:5521 stop:6732 length:1212 start_codon:yes stop_codon:yes gene_type:complete
MSPIVLLTTLCIAQVLAMTSFANFAALLPDFVVLWALSNTEAGWIGGIYYAGYVVAVPLLVGLTDIVDAKRVYLLSMGVGVAGSIGFALLAEGFWSAMGFRFLSGIALAGTYMPGLQILNDRLPEAGRQRMLPWYLSAFSLGTAASFYMSGWLSTRFAWPSVFFVAGVAQAACLLLVMLAVVPRQPTPGSGNYRHPLDFRPVFTNRAALAYIWGYTGHTYELFAYRAWIVAFLVFAAAASGAVAGTEAITGYAALFSLIGMPVSVIGAQLALRGDRCRTVSWVMVLSMIVGMSLGFIGTAPFVIVVVIAGLYSGLIMGDSAALTGGTVAAARQGERGATLAMHSVMGFSGGFLGPLIVGLVLDLAGGRQSSMGWGLAFVAMAAGSLLALVGLRQLLERKRWPL